MTRAVIVSSATLARHGRMDAGYYVGRVDGKDAATAVDQARQLVNAARRRLAGCLRQQRAQQARIAAMVAAGEIVPLA